MADVADLADHQIEQSLQQALRTRAPVIVPRGTCHNCDEPARGLFCDPECRDDWEKRERLT
jgi:hypothetical protein